MQSGPPQTEDLHGYGRGSEHVGWQRASHLVGISCTPQLRTKCVIWEKRKKKITFRCIFQCLPNIQLNVQTLIYFCIYNVLLNYLNLIG